MPDAVPTPFDDLNDLLADFVRRVRATLGERFVGVYLTGSFATGGSDADSDVDFIVAIDRDLNAGETAALNALHADIHALPNPWARRLDGSYAPVAILRRWSLSPRHPPGERRSRFWADPGTGGAPARVYPLLYLGAGEAAVARSEHDNTRVMRWTLRERGIALAGPPAAALVDVVSPRALKAEVRGLMRTLAARLPAEPGLLETRAVQGFMALLWARMLQAAMTGRVGSKPDAVMFVRQALDGRWAGLVERAWTGRRVDGDTPSDPNERAETLAFYAAFAPSPLPPAKDSR